MVRIDREVLKNIKRSIIVNVRNTEVKKQLTIQKNRQIEACYMQREKELYNH